MPSLNDPWHQFYKNAPKWKTHRLQKIIHKADQCYDHKSQIVVMTSSFGQIPVNGPWRGCKKAHNWDEQIVNDNESHIIIKHTQKNIIIIYKRTLPENKPGKWSLKRYVICRQRERERGVQSRDSPLCIIPPLKSANFWICSPHTLLLLLPFILQHAPLPPPPFSSNQLRSNHSQFHNPQGIRLVFLIV